MSGGGDGGGAGDEGCCVGGGSGTFSGNGVGGEYGLGGGGNTIGCDGATEGLPGKAKKTVTPVANSIKRQEIIAYVLVESSVHEHNMSSSSSVPLSIFISFLDFVSPTARFDGG